MEEPKPPLSLQSEFAYVAMRLAVQSAEDLEGLRRVALGMVDYMEAQQRTVNQMLRQRWLQGPPDYSGG